MPQKKIPAWTDEELLASIQNSEKQRREQGRKSGPLFYTTANYSNEKKRAESAEKEREDRERKDKQHAGLPDPKILIHSTKGKSVSKSIGACLESYQCQ